MNIKKISISLFLIGITFSISQAQNLFPNNGNVGVGTMNPNSKLEVNGKTELNGKLDVSDEVHIIKELTVDEQIKAEKELVVEGDATFKQDIEVYGDVTIDKFKSISATNGNGNGNGNNSNSSNFYNILAVDNDGKLIKGIALPPGWNGSGTGNPPGPLNAPLCNTPMLGRFNTSYNTFQICPPNLTNLTDDYGAFSLAFDGGVNFLDNVIIGYDGVGWTSNDIAGQPNLFVDGTAEVNGDFYASNINSYNLSANRFNVVNSMRIGVQSPINGTAHDDYKLAVDGKAVFKEAVVTVDNWADFVFEENYQLKTLKEVEDFITENKHLPNVPSEDEILENGVDVGGMNAIMIRKIEELTLYVIELKKENEELKKNINILNDEILH